jgi:hypothetical protein
METPRKTPAVVKWYRLYCGALAFVYLVLVVLFFVGWFYLAAKGFDDPAFRRQLEGMPEWFWLIYLGFLFGICLFLAGVYIAAFFLPRKPWVWIYHMILICIGFTSACCLPAAIPLFIYWLKPETKAYFGRV